MATKFVFNPLTGNFDLINSDSGESLAIGTVISGATAGSVLFIGAGGVLAQDNSNFFWDDSNNRLGIGAASPAAMLDIVQSAFASTDAVPVLELEAGAHTTLPASTEFTDVNFDLARTIQFSTGALTTQRAMRIQGQTLAAVGASTITNAITLEVDPPTAGTNVTITNNRAALFNGRIEIAPSNIANAIILSTANSNVTGIDATASSTLLRLRGNKNAGTGTISTPDVLTDSSVTRTAGYIFGAANNGTVKVAIGYQGTIEIVPSAASSGTIQSLIITNAAHTGQTASTEIINIINTAYTRTWATGAITTQREIYFAAPTYAFAGASTITTAITLDVDKPVAGTNATITNNRAIRSNGILEVANASSTSQIILSGGSSNVSDIETTVTNTGIRLVGNVNAATSTSTIADVNVVPNVTRTAGNVFRVSNNSLNRFSVNYQGTATACETATSAGTARSFIAANPNHTGQTAGTEINNWLSGAYTRTWATGAITTQREILFDQPTYAFSGASTVTTAICVAITAPAAGSNATFTNTIGLRVGAAASIGATSASMTYNAISVPAHTVTVTGTTQVTSTIGFAALSLNAITVTDSSAVTINNSATLYVSGPPVAGGSVTLTNAYALWVDSGETKLDGTLTVGGVTTFNANITMAENVSIDLDTALSADGTYSGICETGTAGATLAFGDVVYLAAADSRWELADASAASTSGSVKIGICVLAAASDGSATKILLYGKVRADAVFPAFTISAPVYISETAGDLTTTQPTTTDAVIRVMGFGNTADELFFCPSPDYMTHT